MSPEDLEYYDVHEEMKLNLISQYTDVQRIVTHSAVKDEEGLFQCFCERLLHGPHSVKSSPLTTYTPDPATHSVT